jgi:hypothetical protein
MPKGPKGEKRPPDVVGAAVRSMRVLTGEDEDRRAEPKKAEAGRKGGLKGGKARAKKLTGKERSESAKKAARTRWSRDDA